MPATRTYNSERRTLQAAETRRQIVQAARYLFAQRGYAAVSVEEIAARAGVAPATVYAAGGKRDLLEQVIEAVVTVGTGRPVGISPDTPPLRAIGDVDEVIRVHVGNMRALKERGAAAHSVLWRAATSDVDAARIWNEFVKTMYAGQLSLTTRLQELGALRPDLDPRGAADIIQALARPEAYDAIVVERGWSLDRWAAFMEDAIRRLLLAR
jgi:AcrR family transcriptional regulator